MKNTRLGDRLSRLAHRFRREKYFLAAALLLALVAAWPLLSEPGLLNTRGGGDSPFLLQRLQQLVTALGDGHFPVRWMPDANYGYGYPFYNFYAPLSIYIAALFRFFGFSLVVAIKLSQFAGFLVAAWAMFLLGRRWLGGLWPALLAAAAYTLAPFHLVNVYVRGDSLAEFWAMAIYPLIFLAADQLLRVVRGKVKEGDRPPVFNRKVKLVALALAYGALILSHNISALIISPFLLLFLIITLLNDPSESRPEPLLLRERLAALRWPLLALLLGLALSAWFWLPALAERSLAQLDPVTSGYFHYSNHFRGSGLIQPLTLIQPNFLFDYDVSGGRAFRMGLVQAVLVILGLIALLLPGKFAGRQQPDQPDRHPVAIPIRLFLVAGLAISTFMITPLSRFLWDGLPLLSFTQFPWRFLSVQAFFGALIIAALARLRGRQFIVPLVLGLLLIGALGHLNPDFLRLNDSDVSPERLAQYEWFSGNIGSTVSAEYLPNSVQPRPYTSPWLKYGVRDTVQDLEATLASARILERQATQQKWQFDNESSDSEVTVSTLAWPEWQAGSSVVSGQPIPLEAAAGSGLIMMALPPGDQTLDLKLGSTPVRRAAELVALVALLAVAWLVISTRWLRLRKIHGLIIFGLFLLFLILKVWPEKQFSGNNLTWDFAQMAYLHHDEEGVLYDNGIRLRSYNISGDEALAGDTLTITLLWEGGGGEEATVALATPAVNRFKSVPLLVSQTKPLFPGENIYQLALPPNSPAGLYVPQVTVEEANPLTPSGQTRGDLFLRPVRIRNTPLNASGRDRSLDARATQVIQRDPVTLEVHMQWLSQAPLTENYNFSLRLINPAGLAVAQLDNQPGYGFQPSSGWPAGEWVNDWLALSLPPDLSLDTTRQPLSLSVRLYDVASGDVVLVRPLGELTWLGEELIFEANQPLFEMPESLHPISVDFGEVIGLRGYELLQEAEKVSLTLYWQALSGGRADYSHFVHLVNQETGEIVTQHDGMPQYNNYPTSLWSMNEIVADNLALDLRQVPEGLYELVVGLYHLLDGNPVRLPLTAGEGLDNDAIRLPEQLIIERP